MKSRDIVRLIAGVLVLSTMIACNAIGNIVSQAPTPTKIIYGIEQTPSATQINITGDQWTGTIQTTTNGDYGAAGTCTGEKWNSSLDLIVGNDGNVTGTGQAHLVAGPKCSGPGAGNLKTDATMATFNVTGTFDGEKFKLTFNETNIDGQTAGLFNYALLLGGQLEFPVIGKGSAGGTIAVSRSPQGGSATANAQHIVDLKCAACK
jgi:hypothetical protein